MSVKIQSNHKDILISRALIIGMVIILTITAIAIFGWIATDQVIAPPGLRVLDWLWKVFICRYPVQS